MTCSIISSETRGRKILFKKKEVWHNYFCKKYKTISLYKAISFACSLANRDKSVAATWPRKCSGGILFFFNIYKDYFENSCSKALFCNSSGQDGKSGPSQVWVEGFRGRSGFGIAL